MLRQRLACDRCHVLKEKCVFKEANGASACLRCASLSKRCTTSRRKGDVGRPRKPERTPTKPQAGAEFVWFSLPSSSPRSQEDNLKPAAQDAGPSQEPQSSRTSSLTPSPTPTLLVCPSDTVLANRTPQEMLLLEAMFDKQRFICRFLLGSSFADPVLAQLLAGLYAAPDTLLNIFLACSGRLASLMEPPHARDCSDLDYYYAHSAKAVRALRQAGARAQTMLLQMTDLLTAVTLGLGVITFDLLDSGLHAHSICRFTLGLAEQFFYTRSPPRARIPELDGALTPLVFMDTCNCVIQRQLPVCELDTQQQQQQQQQGVDRYIGLCGSLLPYLAALCRVSHQLAAARSSRNESRSRDADDGRLARDLDGIQEAVGAWDPAVPVEFVVRSTLHEVQAVKRQASIMRGAALLVIHRVRFGFGTRDDEARQLARAILDEIAEMYGGHQVRNPDPDPHHPAPSPPVEYRLGFAFLVAAVELQDEAGRASALERLRDVVSRRMYPNASERLRRGLVSIWDARDGGFRGHWFDLVPRIPRFVLF